MRTVTAALMGACLLTGEAAADGYDTVRDALQSGDQETAYTALAEMGDAGDTLAMIMLSYLQLSEVSGPQGLGLSIVWLEQAAAEGNIHAMLRLGAMYQRTGPALFPDRSNMAMAAGWPEAIRWYGVAEEAGSPVALTRLGVLHRLGLSAVMGETMTPEEERALSIQYLEQAVAAEQVEAMAHMAITLRTDDPARASEFALRAAAAGHPAALGLLAGRPQDFGVTDPVEALAWKMAAKIAWALAPDPRSQMFILPGAQTGAEFNAMMDEAIAAASPADRAAAEARAAEISAGWTSLLPGHSGDGGGGLFGRD